MHWTRIGIGLSAMVALIGTCLPWLVNVPPKVLSVGDGTILGITTVQGMIAAACAVGALVIVLTRGARSVRVTRAAGAGLIGLAVVAVAIGSLVLGTSQAELLDEAEKQTLELTGDKHQANLAVIAMGKLLDEHPMENGVGMIPFALGWAVLALIALVGLFLKAPPPGAQIHADPPPT